MLFKFVQFIATSMVYMMVLSIVGLSATPVLYFLMLLYSYSASWDLGLRALVLGMSLGVGFFLFGGIMYVLAGLTNRLLCLNLKEGHYQYTDAEAIKWFCHNSLVQLIKAFYMNLMLLTPSMNIFFTLMGAKLGKNVHINTKFCADLSLLEIGDNTIVGGNATVIAHIFERKSIRLKKVKIGRNVLIGLNTVIMPGCEIGDGAIIGAGAVLVKDTIVPANDIYAGVPARSILRDGPAAYTG